MYSAREHAFFVDFEGERGQGNVSVALEDLAREAGLVRVFDSHPDRMRDSE